MQLFTSTPKRDIYIPYSPPDDSSRLPGNIPVYVHAVYSMTDYHYNIDTLAGLPLFTRSSYDITYTSHSLKSLEGSPLVAGSCYCRGNNLTTLIGSPFFVSGNFNCTHNNLTTLEGAPLYVGGNFSCTNNPITDFTHLPRYIEFDLYCSNIPGQTWVETRDLIYNMIKTTKRFLGGIIIVPGVE